MVTTVLLLSFLKTVCPKGNEKMAKGGLALPEAAGGLGGSWQPDSVQVRRLEPSPSDSEGAVTGSWVRSGACL